MTIIEKEEITELVFGILDEREKHSEKPLAQHTLDKAIEQCYRPKPFQSDEERLEYLFRMYEEMTNKEKKIR